MAETDRGGHPMTPPPAHKPDAPAPATAAPAPDMEPRKAYTLNAGKEHSQDGTSVKAGDTVYLTKSQAGAFRDKFTAKDDSDFAPVPGGYKPYSQSTSTDGETEHPPTDQVGQTKGEQGDPVTQRPMVVTKEQAGTQGSQALPDPTAIDPGKQGQQSREMRADIDGGKVAPAPMPKNLPSVGQQQADVRGEEKKDDKKADEPAKTNHKK